jgi:hypothetical protein
MISDTEVVWLCHNEDEGYGRTTDQVVSGSKNRGPGSIHTRS